MLRTLLNLIWLVLAGIELAVGYVIGGLVMMITIVGIPFGLQAFKLAGFALWPFGRQSSPETPASSPAWATSCGWS